MIRHLVVALLSSSALTAVFWGHAVAQTQPAQTAQAPTTSAPTAQPTQLDTVTTAATRTKRPIDAVPGTVSVITDREIDRDNRTNMRDLVRDEPGVSVGNQPGRGGFTNYVIRGIGGNRVLLMVDGMRVPDMPGTNAGSPTGYTRDFVDIESLKRVEIVRGPASALYGSDALGGVIAYTTKDPGDYLTDGRNVYGSVKAGYSGDNYGFYETFTGAIRQGEWEMLGLYTRRDFHNMKLATSSQYESNPQNNFENSFLAKFVLRPNDTDVIRVIGEYTDKVVKSQNLSLVGNFASTLVYKVWDDWSHDRSQRYRLSTEWEHNAPIGFVDRFTAMAYYSGIVRAEDNVQLQAATIPNPDPASPSRYRISQFWSTQDVFGAELQGETKAGGPDLSQYLTYGASFSYTRTTRPRNRVQMTLATGALTWAVGGENYPNKNFPDTENTQIGVYLQDEITAGRWTVTPAVRFDYYTLRANPDAMFWRSGAGTNLVPQDSNYFSISPKLGAIYRFTNEYSGYAQYARGFRAPPYDNANFGFVNATSFYQIIPNSGLVPETADSFEVGVRGKYASGSSFQLSGFYNLFKNFIDTVTVNTVPVGGFPFVTFQYQNRPSVNIWGFEARGEYRFNPEWAVLGYLAFAKGTDEATGQPIDSVDPFKLQGRVRYGQEVGFGAQLISTFVGSHTATSTPAGPNTPPYFQAPAYFNLDATISYNWTPHFKINAGAFNITDAKYWNAQDVIGVQWSNTQLDRLTQPGRYFGVNVTAKW
jgi:hemoglobin/transferrin/lactoferrin receptor protein